MFNVHQTSTKDTVNSLSTKDTEFLIKTSAYKVVEQENMGDQHLR